MAFHPRDSDLLRRIANIGRATIPPIPDPSGPPRPPKRLEVFATGVDHVQLTWSALGPGPVRFTVADTVADIVGDGGPGAVTLGGLPAGTALQIDVAGDGLVDDDPLSADTRTLTPPPGERVHRIGTLNDVHIGQESAGYFHTLIERPTPAELHPVRCARAAITAAIDTGIDRLLIKGDLTHASTPENWAEVDSLIADVGVPVDIVPGNHEGSRHSTVIADAGLGLHGHRLIRGVETIDAPGVRLILADSTIPGRDWGTVNEIGSEIVDRARGAEGTVLIGIHHQPMPFDRPVYLPPGIPASEFRAFARDLAAVTSRALVTTGHTHRHRRRAYGSVTVTEIGSTKDFPGTWASYDVYEGGIVQVVHRIAEPDCIRWTDHTRRAAAGAWQFWAPGSLSDRCFSLVHA